MTGSATGAHRHLGFPVARKPAPKKVKADEPRAAALPVDAPIALARVIGQAHALRVLTSAQASDRLHHAWVFHGPIGVGKMTTALAFSALLLDPTSTPGLDGSIAPDPDSPVQRLLAAGTHPDLHVVRKELARFSADTDVQKRKQRVIPVDVIREFLIEPAAKTAMAAPGARATKVFIVDEAELMADAAQNALLKTLEEPPPGTLVILVTSRPDRLLPTIRSRSQMVGFAPLTEAEMRAWIRGRGLEAEGERARWLLEFACGSPGVYEAADVSGLHDWALRLEPLLAAGDAGRYSPDLGPAMHDLVEGWAEAYVKERPQASKEAANHAGAAWLFRLLAERERRGMRAGRGGAERNARAIDAIRRAETELEANVNALFVMDHLAAELAACEAN